ncbi:TetR family transcriptional regulator [Finegoldia sp. BIOML-A3]|uniref:TetR/AcrR family transcriptional regulator n=2 Tax=Peptoniphilus TaxID=162289 RepID=A0A943SPG6_9FIRM|nr:MULTISPECIES: TetR/AcrR family transcriptional regulator [Peptoniphilaceae]MBM7550395.1 AcrR family transcriptional regulator [Peptoniphilus gorbachii]MBS6534741.1 TetR/AcrR family transcriptional regulator [Peptoniphilus harei]MDU1023862.1 TetR/AcrR family transcriptional regulator [Peptoniphilus harei]MSA99668.1 TetR family transcriptional regulator [Finegoldia sp. BIOML-A3]MSB93654.1 TetR family transcriptional regulator [Finegoldia sp. BIOML-A4]
MNDKKLKVGEKRKLEILEAAKKCFLEKGFQNTTMEDVIEKVSLSKGGVYYYYGSTYEMIYDFMKLGIKYRGEKNKTIDTSKLTSLDAITEIMMERIYDENEFKSIYAIFLKLQNEDKRLCEMFENLKETNTEILLSAFPPDDKLSSIFEDEFLVTFVNTLILGYESLNQKEIFIENKKTIKKMLEDYLREKLIN